VTETQADRLILEAATGARQLTTAELEQVLEHVAQAGFDPDARETVRGRLAGLAWQGQTLTGSDRLSPREVHYLWHVVQLREWPAGTTVDAYAESIQRVILDPTSGVFTHRFYGTWQVGIIRESRDLRGPRGHEWTLVQYRVSLGRWVTAFQPRAGLAELTKPQWSDLRWLRRPTRSSGP
jgi:hypothetical protein